MKNEEIKNLAISLAKADTEKEVVAILKKARFWSDNDVWREYDDNPINYSTIGNQQKSPDSALVEKIINSVDAVMMRECLRRNIKPDGNGAPKSIAEAQKKFFGIYNGKLSSIDATQRVKLSENILLVATGGKTKVRNPSYAIIDAGEGQTPNKIPKTFLTLTKDNKIKIPFVQGKFGMGGSGALRFSSPEYKLQLLISKRDPKIQDNSNDDTKNKWGITIIRKEDPREGMKSSVYTYLAPNKNILAFVVEDLPLLPKQYPNAYGNPFKFGTFIKLYEYELTGLKTNITLDPYNRFSLLMPDIALPIRMIERRKGYEAHSYESTLSGLSVRLAEDKRKNLEYGFYPPSSGEITIQGQKMDYRLYAFKKGGREKYAKSEGIIFAVNGQFHGFLSKNFFKRKTVGMDYLSDSILVVIDCSKISRKTQEDLFMNSRDCLSSGPLRNQIEKQLEDVIKNHQGLRELREKRIREDFKEKTQNSKPIIEALENIIKKSPSLTKLFIQGARIKNPFRFFDSAKQVEFKGKEFPTYFKLSKEYPKDKPKMCPINRRFRVQYETDANNDYFNRDKEPGEFMLKMNDIPIENYSLNLWNGLATLTVSLPLNTKIYDEFCFQSEVSDIAKVNPFSNLFCIKTDKSQKKQKGGGGKRKFPPSDNDGKDRKKPSGMNLPEIKDVRRNEWNKYDFQEDTALEVKHLGEERGYLFRINMDNVYLQTEIKGNYKINPILLEERFKCGMVLIGISLLDFDERNKKKKSKTLHENNEEISIYDKISLFSKAVSPVLLPMISSLSELKLDS